MHLFPQLCLREYIGHAESEQQICFDFIGTKVKRINVIVTLDVGEQRITGPVSAR